MSCIAYFPWGEVMMSDDMNEAQADKRTLAGYLFFWSGQQVSLLGSSIAQFAIIWWVTLDTGSALYLSIASFVGFVPMVVLGPVAGVLADRWNRKLIIGVADFLQALATVVLICLFYFIECDASNPTLKDEISMEMRTFLRSPRQEELFISPTNTRTELIIRPNAPEPKT